MSSAASSPRRQSSRPASALLHSSASASPSNVISVAVDKALSAAAFFQGSWDVAGELRGNTASGRKVMNTHRLFSVPVLYALWS